MEENIMTKKINLNMEDLGMVAGGTVVRENGECVIGQIEKVHVHKYHKIEEEWVSPPGGVYSREHMHCDECGDDYWTDWVNHLEECAKMMND